MELSNDLISQFVKATKDTTKNITESIVYGTVQEDTSMVLIDGSDVPTPVTTSVVLNKGDRVTILLKNHEAIVTGNTTSPAPRKDDVLDVSVIAAIEAKIVNLETEKLSAKDIEGKYANIDFSNITKATMKEFYATSGIIKDAVLQNGVITGELSGVKISGDLILANTLVADRLIIKGKDGLYYKLNTDGITVEKDQTEQNSLNGAIITAKTITASKIKVTDLQAFGATIGGFKISENSLYSGVKSSPTNTTRGIYLGSDGQLFFGDATNYIKYIIDADGNSKLQIAADNITFGANRTYSSAANMYVTSNGLFGRSTSSSERYKEDITVADVNCFSGLYNLPVKKFKYKSGYLCGEDERCGQYLYGFVVEDLVDILPCAVEHITDENGDSVPEMWNSNIIVPALLKLIQDLNNRVKVLEGTN